MKVKGRNKKKKKNFLSDLESIYALSWQEVEVEEEKKREEDCNVRLLY